MMDPIMNPSDSSHTEKGVAYDINETDQYRPGLAMDDGYILDVNQIHGGKAPKLAADDRTVLIPQPSDDSNDPLNWSQTKKNIVLAVVCACTFLPDYGSVTGAVTLIPQAK